MASAPVSGRHSPRILFFRLAWRNVWRNKKRTLIACASIFFAVFLAVAMSSMQTGQHEYMINTAVRFSTGHVQIHGKGYWDTRSLDESMDSDSTLLKASQAIPMVACVVPRFESFALISRGNATRVSPVTGIDPAREDAMTSLGSRVIRGVPFLQWNHGAIIAEGLARIVNADVGDSIVIYGQGYQGVTAAGVVPVAAIVRFPIPDMNNTGVYLTLPEMQSMFAAPGRITSIVVLLHRDDELSAAAAALTSLAGPEREVMTWRQMMPELVQAIAVDDGGTVIMLLILYVVIGFGIFGTVMMMTAERRHEFGVIIAVGMKRWKLMFITGVEALMVSMLGATAGILAAIPLVAYFAHYPIHLGGDYAQAMLAYGMEPIIPLSTDPVVFLLQGLSVFFLGAVSALYPIIVLRSLNPVQAMRR